MDTPPKIKITSRLVDVGTYKKYLAYILITGFVALIALGGYSIYRFFVPKKPAQSNQITVQSGGQATIIQRNERKRFVVPFVEGGAEARDREKIGAFLRAGVRVEF